MMTPNPPSGAGESDLSTSERFAIPPTRRDVLGLAAILSALGTFIFATIGALRLPMPAVFPESNPKVKLGRLENFAPGSETRLPHLSLWVFRDADGGIYAISSVCTHLGCIAGRTADREFLCPCHGSRFTLEGKVTAGPAPSTLQWLELGIAPDGQLFVDRTRMVKPGTRLMV